MITLVDTGAGHGTLVAFHDGCRCGWCESVARERGCPCATCAQVRSTSTYVDAPRGKLDR